MASITNMKNVIIDSKNNLSNCKPLQPFSSADDIFKKIGVLKGHKITYNKFTSDRTFKVPRSERLAHLISALVKTILSLGLALATKSTRRDWSVTWHGKKAVIALIAKGDLQANEKSLTIKDIALKAMKIDGRLQDLPPCLQDNEEVVTAALDFGDSRTLQYASTRLRDKEEVVAFAVEKHGNALQYASDEKRKDRNIAIKAIKSYGEAIEHISSDTLRQDPDIVRASEESKKKQKEYHDSLRGLA